MDLMFASGHDVAFAGKLWEVDEFESENAGLTLAEVELEAEEEAFELPEWVGRDISTDHRFFNASLAKHPFCQWRYYGSRDRCQCFDFSYQYYGLHQLV